MGYRNYASANGFIVAKDGNGDFSTIATALTAATSGTTIFIRPGTYTENLTLKAGVNLTAWPCDAGLNPQSNTAANVIIKGKATFTGAGTVSISGIQLKTNADYFLVVSGNSASIVNLTGCFLNCLDGSGINYTSSSASSQVNITYCQGNLGTTGIKAWACTATGILNVFFTTWTNSGLSTTASTISSTDMNVEFSQLYFPLSITSSSPQIRHSWIDTSGATATGITTVTSGTTTITHTAIVTGSSSGVSCGSGTEIGLNLCEVSSTNTNALTGSGTINSYGILFSNTSFNNNATTSGGGAMTGLTQGTAPTAGFLGEQIRSTASTTISNGSYTSVTNIALTPGIWDVSLDSNMNFSVAGTNAFGMINNTSNSATGRAIGDNDSQLVIAGITTFSPNVASYRITLSSTTTYYATFFGTFASGTCTVNARISATRVG